MRSPETKMSPAPAATGRGTKAQHNKRISESSGSPERTAAVDARRVLKQARRALGAALAQGHPPPDLVAAAELVTEAGGTK